MCRPFISMDYDSISIDTPQASAAGSFRLRMRCVIVCGLRIKDRASKVDVLLRIL